MQEESRQGFKKSRRSLSGSLTGYFSPFNRSTPKSATGKHPIWETTQDETNEEPYKRLITKKSLKEACAGLDLKNQDNLKKEIDANSMRHFFNSPVPSFSIDEREIISEIENLLTRANELMAKLERV
ncbi:unnamed protein product [Blepharisma stoltei]|uniref:Uncharacterized protein n=1 Tax=Blepharisma stoltei TaxID=1481888 RepID=A0AAU9JBI1_9CILI|nr:unnamed protein product [Blepharisma stoltei]